MYGAVECDWKETPRNRSEVVDQCVARPTPPSSWCTTWTSRRPASLIYRTRGKEGSCQVSEERKEGRGFRGIEMICDLRLVTAPSFVSPRNEYVRRRFFALFLFLVFPSFDFLVEREGKNAMFPDSSRPARFFRAAPEESFPPMSQGICTLLPCSKMEKQ